MTLLISPHHVPPEILRVLCQNTDTAFLYILSLAEENKIPLIVAARLLEQGAYKVAIHRPPSAEVASLNKH